MTNYEANHEVDGANSFGAEGSLVRPLDALDPAVNRATVTHIETLSTERSVLLIDDQPNTDPDDIARTLVEWEAMTEGRDDRRIVIIEDTGIETGGVGRAAARYADSLGVTIINVVPLTTEEAEPLAEPPETDDLASLIIDLVNGKGMVPLVVMSGPRRAAIVDRVRERIVRQGSIDRLPFETVESVFEHDSGYISFSSYANEQPDSARPVTFMGLSSPNVGGHVPTDRDQLLEVLGVNPDLLAETDIVHVSDTSSPGDIETATAFVEQYLHGRNPSAPIILVESIRQAQRVNDLAGELRRRGIPISGLVLVNDVYKPEVSGPTTEVPIDPRIQVAHSALGRLFEAQPDLPVLFGRAVSVDATGGDYELYSHLITPSSLEALFKPVREPLLTGAIARLAQVVRGQQLTRRSSPASFPHAKAAALRDHFEPKSNYSL